MYFQCELCFVRNQFVNSRQGKLLCTPCRIKIEQQIEYSSVNFYSAPETARTRSNWNEEMRLHGYDDESSASSVEVIGIHFDSREYLEDIDYTIFDDKNKERSSGCLQITVSNSDFMITSTGPKKNMTFGRIIEGNGASRNTQVSSQKPSWSPFESSFPGLFHLMDAKK